MAVVWGEGRAGCVCVCVWGGGGGGGGEKASPWFVGSAKVPM